tara:strand:- start:2792 stop:3208 length:417 start_codon:yes stop_codon:yes gene_type:complete
VHLLADVSTSTPNLWAWFTGTATVDGLLQVAGVGILAWAILTDRLMTRGQHLRRVADLVEHHAREIAQKDAAAEIERRAAADRFADKDEAYRLQVEAAREDRQRADRITEQYDGLAEVMATNVHALESIEEAAREAAQ